MYLQIIEQSIPDIIEIREKNVITTMSKIFIFNFFLLVSCFLKQKYLLERIFIFLKASVCFQDRYRIELTLKQTFS